MNLQRLLAVVYEIRTTLEGHFFRFRLRPNTRLDDVNKGRGKWVTHVDM